jgi:hypothetical protein
MVDLSYVQPRVPQQILCYHLDDAVNGCGTLQVCWGAIFCIRAFLVACIANNLCGLPNVARYPFWSLDYSSLGVIVLYIRDSNTVITP